jgi:colanic acid/amylovoran biosynthesis glycosyltransferase
MRVLHVVGTFLGVTENWIYPQVTQVPGIDSAVLCNQALNGREFPLDGIRLFRRQIEVPRFIATAPKPIRAVRRITNYGATIAATWGARRWRPSLVHAHFGPQGWETLHSRAVRPGTPLVTSFYGYDAWMLPTLEPQWRKRFADLFVAGTVFLAEGPALRRRLIELGCAPEKVRIQRLGVDLTTLHYRGREFADPLDVALIGRFTEKKGLEDGLQACIRASRQGAKLRVTIVGDSPAGDIDGQHIKQNLKALAQDPAICDRVAFTGFMKINETRSILAAHDIFLCPSKFSRSGDAEGGLPVALIEAMALGLVCVGSRHCDIPEAIIDRDTGFLFDENDIEDLSNIITQISQSRIRLPLITRNARSRIEAEFSQSRQLVELGDAYRTALSQPAAPTHVAFSAIRS